MKKSKRRTTAKVIDAIFYIASFILCASLAIVINGSFGERAIVIAAISAAISFIVAIVAAICTK